MKMVKIGKVKIRKEKVDCRGKSIEVVVWDEIVRWDGEEKKEVRWGWMEKDNWGIKKLVEGYNEEKWVEDVWKKRSLCEDMFNDMVEKYKIGKMFEEELGFMIKEYDL
jgi:hypothetical protein